MSLGDTFKRIAGNLQIGKTELDEKTKEEVITTEQTESAPLLKFSSVSDAKKDYFALEDDESTEEIDESISGIGDYYFITEGSTAESKKLEKNEEGFYQTTVETWGSAPSGDLKYANDCMSRIIGNYYSDIALYSEEYDMLLKSLMEVNGIKESDVIVTGQKIILPIPVRDEAEKLIGFIEPTTEEEKEEFKEAQEAEEVELPKTIEEAKEQIPEAIIDGKEIDEGASDLEAGVYALNDGTTIVKNEDGTWSETENKSDGDGGSIEYINTYDSEGNLTTATYLTKENGEVVINRLEYDENGKSTMPPHDERPTITNDKLQEAGLDNLGITVDNLISCDEVKGVYIYTDDDGNTKTIVKRNGEYKIVGKTSSSEEVEETEANSLPASTKIDPKTDQGALNKIGLSEKEINSLVFDEAKGVYTYTNDEENKKSVIIKNEDGTWTQKGLRFYDNQTTEFVASYGTDGKKTDEVGVRYIEDLQYNYKTYYNDGVKIQDVQAQSPGHTVEIQLYENGKKYGECVTKNMAFESCISAEAYVPAKAELTSDEYNKIYSEINELKGLQNLVNKLTELSEAGRLDDFKLMYARKNHETFESYIGSYGLDDEEKNAALSYLKGIETTSTNESLYKTCESYYNTNLSTDNLLHMLKLSDSDLESLYQNDTSNTIWPNIVRLSDSGAGKLLIARLINLGLLSEEDVESLGLNIEDSETEV